MVVSRRDDWDAGERAALGNLREELRELRERHKDDPPVELLRAARAGALPEEQQKDAEEYLERSAWSRTLIEGAGLTEASLDSKAESRLLARIQAETRKPERPRVRFYSFCRLAAVSATVLIIASGVFILRNRFQTGGAVVPPNPTTVAESQSRGTIAPLSISFLLPLEKPQIKLSANALLYRGSPEYGNFLKDLAPAVEAYREGDFARAEKSFAALILRYPKSSEVRYYSGICRLFTNDSPGAVRALQSARGVGDRSLAPDISWYLAVAYERVDRPADAHTELESLCRGKNDYSARACELEAKIGLSPGAKTR